MLDPYADLMNKVTEFFESKLEQYGDIPRGVDWASEDVQRLRFQQIIKVVEYPEQRFSINDYGCGYGALVPFLAENEFQFTYFGYDISEVMRLKATENVASRSDCHIASNLENLPVSDYTLASGVFNKMPADINRDMWESYVLNNLEIIASKSKYGFAFNMLSIHSPAERIRPGFYYGDPVFYFEFCRTKIAPRVALLHDYKLFDFTILVRLKSPP